PLRRVEPQSADRLAVDFPLLPDVALRPLGLATMAQALVADHVVALITEVRRITRFGVLGIGHRLWTGTAKISAAIALPEVPGRQLVATVLRRSGAKQQVHADAHLVARKFADHRARRVGMREPHMLLGRIVQHAVTEDGS